MTDMEIRDELAERGIKTANPLDWERQYKLHERWNAYLARMGREGTLASPLKQLTHLFPAFAAQEEQRYPDGNFWRSRDDLEFHLTILKEALISKMASEEFINEIVGTS